MSARAVLVAAAVVAFSGAVHAEVYLQVDEALRLAYPDADEIRKERAILTKTDREQVADLIGGSFPVEALPRIFSFHVARRSGRPIGVAVVDDVPGKSQPITFMLAARAAADGTLEIARIEILAYRESHGWEVRRPEWCGLFQGKRLVDQIRHDRDIRNIAGATISCRSVTVGVRRGLALLQIAALDPESRLQPPVREPQAQMQEGDADQRFDREQLVMGTTLRICCFAASSESAQRAMEAAFAEVRRLDALLSTYSESSEVSRLNRVAGSTAGPASAGLVELLARSLELSRATAGAFDPAMGPLVQLWRQAERKGAAPGEAAISAARAVCGSAQIDMDAAAGRAGLRSAGAALDFGAIGKGHALDRAADAMRTHGVTRALLDFGGQLLALDPPPGQAGWLIEVRDPRSDAAPLARLRLARASIATTADDQRGLMIEGRRISHVVDPRSGRPAEGTLSVSVVADSAATADALSTAIFVLGCEAGMAIAKEQGVGALVLTAEGEVTQNQALARLTPSSAEGRKR